MAVNPVCYPSTTQPPQHIHTYIRTLDNAHNSQVQQSLNLRRRRALGGKRTVDINDEQTDGFLDENLNELKLLRDRMDSDNLSQTDDAQ